MTKISLVNTLKYAYKYVNSEVISIKSSVISVCSKINRFMNKYFDFDVTKGITNISQYYSFINVYPVLSEFTFDEIKDIQLIFKSIRNINAHLFISRDIPIDKKLESKIVEITSPDYNISDNGKLTMFGQFIVVTLLSQKFVIWPFYISYLKRTNFIETQNMKGKQIANYQTSLQHKYQELCGIEKPIYSNSINSNDYIFLNDLFSKSMTNILFNLELECSIDNKSSKHSQHYADYLRDTGLISDQDIDLFVLLRNCWFHGNSFDDLVEFKGKPICFSYEFMLESFISIKNSLEKCFNRFRNTISEINKFASYILDFYVLRLVEVSYKLLDNRLLTIDKVETRVNRLNTAYDRFIMTDRKIIELAMVLAGSEQMKFILSRAKFLDMIPRKTVVTNLNIIKLHSDNGFEIGEFKTDVQDLSFAQIDLDECFQNKINGKYLNEYLTEKIETIGDKITILSSIDSNQFITSECNDKVISSCL